MSRLGALLDGLSVPQGARRRLVRAIVQGKGTDAVEALDPPATEGDAAHAGLLKALEGRIPRPHAPSSRTSFPSPASRPLAAVAPATSPSASWRAPPSARTRSMATSRHCSGRCSRSRAIPIRPRPRSERWPTRPRRPRPRARRLRRAHRLPRRARCRCRQPSASRPASLAISTTTPASFSSCTTPRAATASRSPARRYDNLLGRLGASRPIPAVGASLWLDRLTGDAA